MNKDTQLIYKVYQNMPPQWSDFDYPLNEAGFGDWAGQAVGGAVGKTQAFIMSKAIPWIVKNKLKVAGAAALVAILVSQFGVPFDLSQSAVDSMDPDTIQSISGGDPTGGEIRSYRGDELFPIDSDIRVNPDGSKEFMNRGPAGSLPEFTPTDAGDNFQDRLKGNIAGDQQAIDNWAADAPPGEERGGLRTTGYEDQLKDDKGEWIMDKDSDAYKAREIGRQMRDGPSMLDRGNR